MTMTRNDMTMPDIKIYIISLRDATKRRRVVLEKMQKLGLEFEFFDAVDGTQGVPDAYIQRIDRPAMDKNLRRMVSDVEMCCALSHALLYEKIVTENIAHSIILEDDFLCDMDFVHIIKQDILPNHTAGFVLLYHLYARIIPSQQHPLWGGYSIAPVINNCAGAVGYYVDLPTATQFAHTVFPISYVSDWFTDITAIPAQVVTPRLITHPSLSQSQIENMRKHHIRKRFAGSFFGRLGVSYTLRYKLKKPFSVVVSPTVEGE